MNDQDRQTLASPQREGGLFPWQRGWQALKSIWPHLVYISVATIAIPQYGLFCLQSQRAARLGEAFRLNRDWTLLNLLEQLKEFASSYLWATLLFAVLAILGYISIIGLLLEDAQDSRPWQAVRTGARVLLPRAGLNIVLLIAVSSFALFILVVAPLLGFVGQYLAITLVVLLTALPPLLVIQPQRPLGALREALTMAYVLKAGHSRWSAFFVLLTYQMALVGLISLTRHAQEQLLTLDSSLNLSREFWLQPHAFFPFGLLPMLLEGMAWVLIALVLGGFAIFSSAFVFEMRRRDLRVQL